ncbi:MAG: ABC transporter substrate-binding protein [Solirubrobacteraceae bacterium]|nr:ABC transporter substrate-binding protein [Solirubrobacteraceae bacterium]
MTVFARLRRSMYLMGLTGCMAVAAVGVAACGSDDEASGGTASADVEKTAVSLSVGTISPVASIAIGQEQGFFEDEGIDLKLNTTLAYPQSPGAVVAGQVDFAQHSWGSTLAFAANGLPLVTVAQLSTSGTSVDNDDTMFVTRDDSPIKSGRDLDGKTIAVASLAGLSELNAITLAEKNGLDKDSVKLVVVPFPSMAGALRAKRVDVALMSEPFYTQAAEQSKIRIISPGNALLMPGLPLVNIFTSRSFYDSNRDVVDRMRRAINKSVEYAAENPDAVRQILPGFSKVPTEIAGRMRLPVYSPTVDLQKVQTLSDMLNAAGLQKEKIAAKDLYPDSDS